MSFFVPSFVETHLKQSWQTKKVCTQPGTQRLKSGVLKKNYYTFLHCNQYTHQCRPLSTATTEATIFQGFTLYLRFYYNLSESSSQKKKTKQNKTKNKNKTKTKTKTKTEKQKTVQQGCFLLLFFFSQCAIMFENGKLQSKGQNYRC